MKEKKLNTKLKIKTLASDHKAITLIALVITIIVMLILVSVTVSIAINGGLFSTAKKAVAETQASTDEEQLYSAVLGLTDANTGKVDLEKLQEQLPDWQINKETGKCISPKGNEFTVGDYGSTKKLEYIKVSDIFDENGKDENAEGYDPNKLHIGDFINYDAGAWDESSCHAACSGSYDYVYHPAVGELPYKTFQFGGFKMGDSRNKDYNEFFKNNKGNSVSGWRLFDVKEDGSIVLISSGCREYFYLDSSHINEGYYVCSKLDEEKYKNNYFPRNWGMYVNEKNHGINANMVTEEDLKLVAKKLFNVNSITNFKNSKFIRTTLLRLILLSIISLLDS